MISLKKQVKEYKAELMRKEEDLYQLKRKVKTSHMLEVEQDLGMYREEVVRLRKVLDSNFGTLAGGKKQGPYQSTLAIGGKG